jgi:hypothetical protein
MGENPGEALATIGEIARQHGDIDAVAAISPPSLLDRLMDELRDDVAHLVSERPYAATAAALAVGFFGGLTIAHSRRGRRHFRGW